MVYKASLKLGKINKGMHVSFNMIVHSDDPTNKNKQELISRFTFRGNEYLNITPSPYVTIDISTRATKKTEGWNPNRSINLNGYGVFLLLGALRRLLNNFRTIKELYFYEDGELKVDPNLSKRCKEIVTVNDKTLRLQPVVVPPDEDNIGAPSYEGCAFIINSFDSYQYLTITELEYLIYVLSGIRMGQLSLLLLNTVKANENKIIKKLDKVEEMEIDDTSEFESGVFVRRESPNVLPNI